MRFRHETIDADPPCGRLSSCLTADLTGSGVPDVIVTGLGASPELSLFGRDVKLRYLPVIRDLIPLLETNLFWYENPGWKRRTLATESDLHLGVGSTLHDVDGDGRLDLIVGQGFQATDVYWYEQPKDPRSPWRQHLVTDAYQKYHDLAVGDVDGDGDPELVGLSQEAETIFYYDVPADPYQEPWPAENRHVVDDGLRVEGVRIVDVDGDGEVEIVAGTNVYHRPDDPGSRWDREAVATGWDDTRVVVDDFDEDGDLEILFAEGDSPTFGTHPARVAWFDPPDWEPTFLREDLFCPHSVQTADFTGNGLPDVYVAEMGLGRNDDPKHFVFCNRGGSFEERIVARGIPTHEAKAVDLTGNGRPDVVGKSYGPEHHVDVWYNES